MIMERIIIGIVCNVYLRVGIVCDVVCDVYLRVGLCVMYISE